MAQERFRLTGWIQPVYKWLFPFLAITSFFVAIYMLIFVGSDLAPIPLFTMAMFLVGWLLMRNLSTIQFDSESLYVRKPGAHDFEKVDFAQIDSIKISWHGLFTTIWLKDPMHVSKIKTLNGFISTINFDRTDVLKISKALLYDRNFDDTKRLLELYREHCAKAATVHNSGYES